MQIKTFAFSVLLAVCAATGLFSTSTAQAQIFVANVGNPNNGIPGSVGEYNLSGSVINASLVPGGSGQAFTDVAIYNGSLFVLSRVGDVGKIGQYTLTGTPINASLFTNIAGSPSSLAINNGVIYVSSGNSGVVGAYSTAGTVVNASLISGLQGPQQLTVSGANLFIAEFQGQKISEYTLAGTAVNTSLVSGIGQVAGIALSGNNMFLSENYPGKLSEYTTSGATVNANLAAAGNSRNLAIVGSNIFVARDGDTSGPSAFNVISEYTTSGAVVNSALISGLNNPVGIAVLVPEPSTWALFALGLGVLALLHRRRGTRATPPVV